jgi:drug/metabolite transporter (DMT)-like permease
MRRIWIALVIASFGWGTAGVGTRLMLDDGVRPFTIATLRALLAALAVIGYLLIRRTPFPRGPALKVGVVMGISNFAVPYLTSTVALQYASAGFVGITTALIPLFTAVIAHFTLAAERLSMGRMAGLAVGFAGVVLLIGSGDAGIAGGGRPVAAGVLSLIGVVSIAAGGVYAKRHAGGYEPLEVTGVHFVSGTIVMVVATLIAEGIPTGMPGHSWAVVTYLAVVCTFVPFILYYWMLRQVSATFASLAGYIVPPIAVAAGIVFLSERLERGIVFGGALILAGVLIADRAERRARSNEMGVYSPTGV